jgi:hypothetical protein
MDLYPEEPLWEEVVYLAYHLHWDLDQLLDIEHADRVRLVERVAALNRSALDDAKRMIAS